MNKIYFVLACILLAASIYQVVCANHTIDRLEHTIPKQLYWAYRTGCQKVRKPHCDKDAEQYRKEIEGIWND